MRLDSLPLRNVLPRIALIAACLIFFDAGISLWSQGNSFTNPPLLIGAWGFWLFGIISGVLALVKPDFAKRAQMLVFVAFITTSLQIFAVGTMNATPYTSSHADNEMIERYALEALKHGQNPYSWNFTDAARVFRDSGLLLTPFLDASYQNRLTYPALPTLVLWLFDRVGLGQVRILNLVALLALGMVLWFGAPRSIRALVLVPLFAIKPLIPLPLEGTQDIVWCLFLTGMVVAWRRPVLRATLLGLAINYKQQTWFIVPFLLIAVWYSEPHRLRRVIQFAGIAFGLFALINLPFFVSDPLAWITGVFEPLYAAFNIYSQGLGAFSAFGVLPISREFYSILQLAFYVVAVWVVWRHPRTFAQSMWVIPSLFFWIYYRGLANYWIFWIPPLLISWFHMPLPKAPATIYRRNFSLGISAVILCLPLVILVRDLATPIRLKAELYPPILTFYNGTLAGQLELSITNESGSVFYPRFAVQYDPARQALPWKILYGPDSLAPGASGRYLIGVEQNGSKSFPVDRVAQVIITDAKQGSSVRFVVSIPNKADRELPDRVWNPAFLYWTYGANAPDGWELTPPENGQTSLNIAQMDGRWGLKMQVDDESGQVGKLAQWMSYTDSLSLWVRPPFVPDIAQGLLYGLQFKDGIHELRVLFGGQREELNQTGNKAMLILPAPLDQWSQQRVELGNLYKRLQWDRPVISWRNRNDIAYPAQQVEFSLIVSPGNTASTVAWFGEITLRDAVGRQKDLLDRMLDNPEEYYLGVALQYQQLRNFPQAATAYQTALRYNPKSSLAYARLADVYLAQGNVEEAIRACETALQFGDQEHDKVRAKLVSIIRQSRVN